MKKRLNIILSLAFIALGIAMTVVNFKFDPDQRFMTILGCAYAALGFGTYGALAIRNRKKWQGIFILVLLGIIATGFSWLLSMLFVISYFVGILCRALRGPKKEKVEKAYIELPPGSGFLLQTTDHHFYQLLRGRDQLCFVYLGARMDPPDANLVVCSADDFEPREMNRAIPFKKIRAIRILRDGSFRILGRDGGHFFPQPPATVDDVAAYLEGLPVAVKWPPARRLPKAGERTLQNVFFAASAASGICAAAWMYLSAPARLLGTLNVSLFVLSFALFCLFYDFVESEVKQKNGGPVTAGFLFPLLPLMLHFVRDYNFDSFAQFRAPVAILAGCMPLLFLIANARRRRLGKAIAILVAAILPSLFIVGNINVLWDGGAPAHEQTAIVWHKDMRDDENHSDPQKLWVVASIEGTLKIAPKVYDGAKFGSKVLIVKRTGLFGIDYTTVEIPKQ